MPDQSLVDFYNARQAISQARASEGVDDSVVKYGERLANDANFTDPRAVARQEAAAESPLSRPEPLPYMAKELDAYGRPYYGDGFQGWARKTFATVFAPKNFDYNDPVVASQFEGIKLSVKDALEDKLNWNEWGEKIFGISSSEAAEGLTAQKGALAKAGNEGESVGGEVFSQVTGALSRAPGILWDSFTRVVGVTDWSARKAYAFRAGVNEAANAAWVDKSEPSLGPVEKGLNNGVLASPMGALWDAARLAGALATGRTSWGKVKQTVSAEMAGSQMLYTLLTDEAKKAEFLSRYAAGENPELLALELQNTWMELGGSVFGDPLTWAGAPIIGNIGKAQTLVKIPILGKKITIAGKTLSVPWEVVSHLPTFGDVLGIAGVKIGKARQFDDITRFTESVAKSVIPDLTNLASKADDPNAIRVVIEAGNKAAKEIAAYSQNYSPASLEAVGKATAAGRDATHVLRNLIQYSDDAEGALQVLNDYNKLRTGTEAEKALAATSLMSHKIGNVLTSEAGIQVGEFITRFYDEGGDIQKIIDAAGGDKVKLAESLFARYDRVLHEVYASVDDMHDAAARVKEFSKGGDEIPSALKNLARRYDELPPMVKAVRAVTRKIDAVHGPVVGTMGKVYIQWNPAFFAKNIEGQSIRIMMDMGLEAGAEITGRAVASAKKGWAETITAAHVEESRNMLGYVHEATSRGFGGAASDVLAAKGKVPTFAANRAEAVTSGEIAVRTIRDFIHRALKIQPAEIEDVEKAIPGSRDLLYSLLKKYDGNRPRAVAEMRDVFAKGFIEAEKHVQMPAKLKAFTQDTRLYDAIQAAIKNDAGLGKEEVAARLTDIVGNARKAVEDSLNAVPATLGENVAKEIPEMAEAATDAHELFNAGELAYDTADGFTRITQAYQNARGAMHTLQQTLLARIGGFLDSPGQDALIAELNGAKAVAASFGEMGAVRNTVRAVYADSKKGAVAVSQLWKNSVVGEFFDLSKLHPDLDPTLMSHKDFNKVLWEAYYQWSGKYFHAANIADYNAKMQAIEGAAKKIGLGIDDLLKDDGLFLNAENAMQLAEKHYQEFSLAAARVPEGTSLAQIAGGYLKEYGWTRGKSAILSAVNAERRAKGALEAVDAADVPFEEALQAMANRGAKIPGVSAQVAEEGTKVAKTAAPMKTPPPYDGERPSIARAVYENFAGFENDMSQFVGSVRNAWGKRIPITGWTPEAETALEKWGQVYESRMAIVRTGASALATAKRDFLLHSYDKTYLDHAYAYLSPFHYWTDRTYVRTMEQLVENPAFAGAFAKYVDFNEKQHASLPEWYRQNVQIRDLLGGDASKPLFMNLMASLNPINGLIGIDFNDPYKRTDWVSKSVDDLNKFGPTFSPVIQWAVGLHLYNRGDIDAGQRWFGRLFPQSGYLKAAVTLGQNAIGAATGNQPAMLNAGKFIQNNEFDPFVNFIEDGLDPYERSRVGRALASIEQTRRNEINARGDLTQSQKDQTIGDMVAQLDESAFSHSGDAWDQAVHLATSIRAPGQLMSAVLGIGAKTRTKSDIQIDQFYSQMHKLYALSSTMSADEYKAGWDELRTQYPFMDTLLLARKGDKTRDAAYAYNVLGRIPPGMSDDFLKDVGVMREDIAKFYDSKGFTVSGVKYTESERMRFMAAVLDLGAMLTMPTDATKREWQDAKGGYSAMRAQVSRTVGDPLVWDKVSAYYAAANPDARDKYMQAHPEVREAFNLESQLLVQNPLLYKYYGELGDIEAFYDGQAREALSKKYGDDIYALYYEYMDIPTSAGKAKFLKGIPSLKPFMAAKKAYDNEVNRAVSRMSELLPSRIPAGLQAGFSPESGGQARLAETATDVYGVSADELVSAMSPSLQALVADYIDGGDLPYEARNQLEYLGGYYDLSADDILQIVGAR